MPDAVRLDAAKLSALYGLRSSLRRGDVLEVLPVGRRGDRLAVGHPDGRAWVIDHRGATHVLIGHATSRSA